MAHSDQQTIRREDLANRSAPIGERYKDRDNGLDLIGMDHFALSVKNAALMERFVREVLGGKPYYYAGMDDADRRLGRRVHLFMRVGAVLFQCTEESGPSDPDPSDTNISPHWAFGTTPDGIDKNLAWLRRHNIPVAGPFRHLGVDVVSIYFKTPEGHKLEICTWEPYPEEKSKLIGAPGVGRVDWPALEHDWPNGQSV